MAKLPPYSVIILLCMAQLLPATGGVFCPARQDSVIQTTAARPVKAKFSQEEDQKLCRLVAIHGTSDGVKISTEMGHRNPRQCRDRWNNYLSPYVRRDKWSREDDLLLMQRVNDIGNSWYTLAKLFPGRSVNNVRNRWLVLTRANDRTGPSRARSIECSPFSFFEEKGKVYDIFAPLTDEFQYLIPC